MAEQPKYDLVLARRFREFCKEEIGKQKDVADFLKRDQAVVSKMYRGIAGIHDRDIQKLAKEKKLNTGWYYNGTLPKKRNEPEKKNLMTNLSEIRSELQSFKYQLEYLKKLVIKQQDEINQLKAKK